MLAQLDSVGYSWPELGWNVPVGAGVMDCPIQRPARKQRPTSKIVEDIVKDNEIFAMIRMMMNAA